jgi:opacity protein-like surface antigen
MKHILLAATMLATMPVAAFAGDYHHHSRSTSTSTSTTSYPAEDYSSTERNWMGMEGPYMTVLGGWNSTEEDGAFDPDDGWVGGVAFGGKTRWARAELEGAYRSNDAGAGDDESAAIMGNAYWDIETNTRFTPYIGAGIGAAWVDIDTAGGDDSWEFAYQGMAGANFDVAPNWTVGAEYRYFATTEVAGSTDYNNHGVLGTVRYTY